MQLSGLKLVVIELGGFASGVVALYAAGRPSLAGIFAATIAINRLLMVAWHQ
jgi:hypothetical protein